MAIGAVGGLDYEMYEKPIDEKPIDYTSGVNLFSTGATGTSGGAKHVQPMGMQGHKLDPQMLAQKAQNFQNGLGGTNNPDDHKVFVAY